MKKIIKLFVVTLLLMMITSTMTFAESDWETSATENVASATVEGNNVLLKYTSGSIARSASAEKEFNLSDNKQINLSFTVNVDGFDDSVNRRIYIRKNSTTQIELMNFFADGLYLMGNKSNNVDGLTLEKNKDYNFIVSIDAENCGICFMLDGKKVYEGSIDQTKWNKLDLSMLKVYIRNNTTAKTETGASDFIVKSFSVSDVVSGFKSTPEDGNNSVDANDIKNIAVNFNGVVSFDTIDKQNFELTEDGKIIDIDVTGDSMNAYIVPKNGFLQNKSYSLKFKKVSDIFGNEIMSEGQIDFMTVSTDYPKPTVKFECDNTDIVTTQSAKLNIFAESELGISKIELYVNGEVKETFSGSTGFDFKDKAGAYELYIIAYDKNSYTVTSDTINISIKENELPYIEISGVSSGECIEKDNLNKIHINVNDSDGTVERVEIYDGLSLLTKIYDTNVDYDFSTLPYGRHLIVVKVYDDYGACSQKAVAFTASTASKQITRVETDYSDYKSSGNIFPLGFSKGYFEENVSLFKSSNDYGEEHGTVGEYFVEGKEDATSWSYLETSYTTSAFRVDMDVNVLSKESRIFSYFKTDGVVIDPFVIQNGMLTIKGYSKESASYPFEVGEWHKFSFYVDIIGLKYSVWVDDNLVADNFTLPPGLSAVDTRIGVDANGSKERSGFAFDNLLIRYIEPATQIIAVGYDNVHEADMVSPNANTLRFKMNKALNAVTVKKENINLLCNNKPVTFESAEWNDEDCEVVINISEPLKSNTDYCLELTDEVADSASVMLENGAYAYFSTSLRDVDILSYDLNKANGKISPSVVVKNSTDKTKSIVAILNIMSNKKTIKMSVQELKISADTETTFDIGTFDVNSSNDIELYFWGDIIGQSVLADICK